MRSAIIKLAARCWRSLLVLRQRKTRRGARPPGCLRLATKRAGRDGKDRRAGDSRMLSRSKEPWARQTKKERKGISVVILCGLCEQLKCVVFRERILSVGSASLRQMGHPR